MSKEQLLKALGVTESELQSLLEKIQAFLATLEPKEKELYLRSQPTLQEALKAFGPSATEVDLQQLFTSAGHSPTTVGFFLPKPHQPR